VTSETPTVRTAERTISPSATSQPPPATARAASARRRRPPTAPPRGTRSRCDEHADDHAGTRRPIPVERTDHREREQREPGEGGVTDLDQRPGREEARDEREEGEDGDADPGDPRLTALGGVSVDHGRYTSRVKYEDPDSSIESEDDIIAAIAPAITSAANHAGVYSSKTTGSTLAFAGTSTGIPAAHAPSMNAGRKRRRTSTGQQNERPLQRLARLRDEEALVDLREHRHAERDGDRGGDDEPGRVEAAAEAPELGPGVEHGAGGRADTADRRDHPHGGDPDHREHEQPLYRVGPRDAAHPREDDVEDHESGDQRCAAPVGDDAIGKSHERLACAHLLKHDVREQPQEAHPGDERA